MDETATRASDGDTDDTAVPFSFAELFYSRTDKSGVILSGNSVFQRTSQYGWDELVGRPHSIVRHPDMPRGVFRLLWDFLEAGRPLGAYVKNRAKDGRQYWVFAVFTPVDGGYLSVRIKPSSAMFPLVRQVYRTLLAVEQNNALSPPESMERLKAEIQALGFDDYETFMAVAIREELAARDDRLGRRRQSFVDRFADMTDNARAMQKEIAQIVSTYEANRYVPLNLQIQSAHLGRDGTSIGVISSNFSKVAAGTQSEIDTFGKSAAAVFRQICEGQFLLCAAKIQDEILAFHTDETAASERAGQQGEADMLRAQCDEYRRLAGDGLSSIRCILQSFDDDYRRMKQCAINLEVIRIMGKVDAARLQIGQSELGALIEELKVFQTAVSVSLGKIEGQSFEMRSDADGIVGALQSAA
jgi:hypothetical protein